MTKKKNEKLVKIEGLRCKMLKYIMKTKFKI